MQQPLPMHAQLHPFIAALAVHLPPAKLSAVLAGKRPDHALLAPPL